VGKYGSFPSSVIPQLLGGTLGNVLGSVPSCSEPFEIPPHVTKCLSKRASFPLSLNHAYKYVLHRLALVGDAAHSVHPLAGQGVNLGFGDAASLVSVLKSGVELGEDIGEVRAYEPLCVYQPKCRYCLVLYVVHCCRVVYLFLSSGSSIN
jgi:ubiquinone biosynthesis monooxygenase Coq6